MILFFLMTFFYGLDDEGEGSSDFEKEEDNRDEDVVEKDLDWMA